MLAPVTVQVGAPVGGTDPTAPVIVPVKTVNCPAIVTERASVTASVGVALGTTIASGDESLAL